MSAPTYMIRTLADFLLVPEDRLGECLREFRIMLDMARQTPPLLEAVADEMIGTGAVRFTMAEKFTWIDDGEGTVAVDVIHGDTTTNLIRGTLRDDLREGYSTPSLPLSALPPNIRATLPIPSMPIADKYARMNKTEAARAQDLDTMKRAGLIAEWWYECWTFRLGDDLRYTPDFVVQKPDGALEVEEVKGFWRDDARAKVKMFAALYPFPVRAYTKMKNGSWDVETFR